MLSFGATVVIVGVVVFRYFARPGDATGAGVAVRPDYWGEWPSAVLAVPSLMLSLSQAYAYDIAHVARGPAVRPLIALACRRHARIHGL